MNRKLTALYTRTITMEFTLDTVTGATAVDPLTKEVMITVQARGTGERR